MSKAGICFEEKWELEDPIREVLKGVLGLRWWEGLAGDLCYCLVRTEKLFTADQWRVPITRLLTDR